MYIYPTCFLDTKYGIKIETEISIFAELLYSITSIVVEVVNVYAIRRRNTGGFIYRLFPPSPTEVAIVLSLYVR